MIHCYILYSQNVSDGEPNVSVHSPLPTVLCKIVTRCGVHASQFLHLTDHGGFVNHAFDMGALDVLPKGSESKFQHQQLLNIYVQPSHCGCEKAPYWDISSVNDCAPPIIAGITADNFSD